MEPICNFAPLALPALVYALREALIGFERLCALFGSFAIRPHNIGINIQEKVKVWLSSRFEQNAK
jgi:hypothetical protein